MFGVILLYIYINIQQICVYEEYIGYTQPMHLDLFLVQVFEITKLSEPFTKKEKKIKGDMKNKARIFFSILLFFHIPLTPKLSTDLWRISLALTAFLLTHVHSSSRTHTHALFPSHTHLLTPTVRLAVCGTLQLSTTAHFTHLAWWHAGSEVLAHLASSVWLSVGFCLISHPASTGHLVVSLRSCCRCDFQKKKCSNL